MPKLYVLSGPDVGKSFDVEAGTLVGRDPECAVRLRDPSVSRRHARVEHGELGWSIVDMQSRNGIHAQGKRVPSLTLDDGEEFTLGEVLVRFRADVSASAAPSMSAPTRHEDARPRDVPASFTPSPVSGDESEIVLEGDWEEPSQSSMAQTVFAPRSKKPHELAAESSTAGKSPSPLESSEVASRLPSPTPSAAGISATRPGISGRGDFGRAADDAPGRTGSSAAGGGVAHRAGAVSGEVAHRTGGTAASSKAVLQYQRVVDRPGFFNADLAQQPTWMKLALWLVAAIVFAGIFWFAYQGTSFLKSRTQHEAAGSQTEENG